MKLPLRLYFILAYLRHPRWDTGVTPPELKAFIAEHQPGRALDIGCGTGTNIVTLGQHGWQTAGFDFAPQAIWRARRKAQAAGIAARLQVGDATDPQLFTGCQFDLVLDMGCLHSFNQAQQLAYRENLQRWLAPGGTFLLYGFLKPEDAPPEQRGLRPSDIAALSEMLRLDDQETGEDGARPSAWFWFKAPTPANQAARQARLREGQGPPAADGQAGRP